MKVKFRLTITLEVDLNGTPGEQIESNLYGLAHLAYAEALYTVGTEATVDSREVQVKILTDSPDPT